MAAKRPKKKKAVKKPRAKKRVTPRKRTIKRRAVKRAKKPAIKKPAIKKKAASAVKKAAIKRAPGVQGLVLGTVTHYFPKVRAAVVKLKSPLSIGDTVRVKGHTTDFTETVNSIQIDHVPINTAKKGMEIGLLVNSRVRQHDVVYKI